MVAVFNEEGNIDVSKKFATPKSYNVFIKELLNTVRLLTPDLNFRAVCIAAPGKIDRANGIVTDFGNLAWHNVHLLSDVAPISSNGHTKFLLENDSNLGGLSEALLIKQFNKVVYLTISTGIGDGVVVGGQIDPALADGEAGQMVIEYDGKLQKWEDFASGRALFKKYGQKASDITDPKIWKTYSKALATGIGEIVATLTPDVIVLGGGVGAHYEKFSRFLEQELSHYENKMVHMPPILKARRPEEAVIYGCYDYIRQSV